LAQPITLGLLKISRPLVFFLGALPKVGITIGAAVGVEETDNPSVIIIGAPVDVVETEGFKNRPGDSLDGGPATGPPNPSGITIGAPVDVVETEGFTKRPGDSLDGGPTTGTPSFAIGPPSFDISDAATLLSGANVANVDLGPPSFQSLMQLPSAWKATS
jgi:hypothetical protein